MINPLPDKAPIETLERTRAFIRDIAFCTKHGQIEPTIRLDRRQKWLNFPLKQSVYERAPMQNVLVNKWGLDIPSSEAYDYLWIIAHSYGYLQISPWASKSILRRGTEFTLTPKAFALLEELVTPSSIFISYKQTESSALALLIESRLKNIDPNIGIFIDKNIASGQSINSRIEEALVQSSYFICLLGKNTLSDSSAVKIEIDLAKKNTDCTIIQICHSGYTPDDTYTQYFGDNKAIIIKQPESAEEYETNMTKLLIRLGYSTI